MHKSEYIEYLQSAEWGEKRKILMGQADWTCSKCGGKATQLHHINYENIGDEELDTDVIPLCKDCHDEVHSKGDYGYEEYTGY